jgi:hypothetical protein
VTLLSIGPFLFDTGGVVKHSATHLPFCRGISSWDDRSFSIREFHRVSLLVLWVVDDEER